MSFILDALRRAEAERERGRVPDLQAVSVGGGAPGDSRPSKPRGSGLRLAAALGVGALLAAAAGGWWLGREPRPASVDTQTSAPATVSPVKTEQRTVPAAGEAGTGDIKATTPATVEPAATENTRTAAMEPVSATPPGAAPASAEGAGPPGAEPLDPAARIARMAQTPPLRAQPEPMPIVPPPPPPVAPRAPGREAAAPEAPAGRAQRETRPSAASAPVVVALRELPDDLRALVPPLTVSGSSYSETRANRLLFLNGRMLREGDPLGDDVKLEAIELRAAILSVRGRHFRIAF